MKVALVHDYLSEFGGAERVLLALSEIWPKAPIYTAFYKKGSPAWERFKDKDIRVSWAHHIPFFNSKLHSPLRFLAPLIWQSFDFSDYDLVIASSSWYITKGFRKGPKTVEVCYCHTPPRWLYGYPTSIEWQKYWPVRIYAAIVGHFMRMYDFKASQKVDYFVANSENVAERIRKFYRKDSFVIYPPVELTKTGPVKKKDYYLVISRIVGGKGLDLAVKAAIKLGVKLKIAGQPAGYFTEYKKLRKLAKKNIEFLGYVSDKHLAKLYAEARAFLALAKDEDFGITPVEAMLAGTPVIAFRGGGYKETVIDGVTGIFFDDYSVEGLIRAIEKFKVQSSKFKTITIRRHAQKFSKERFKSEIKNFVKLKTKNHT
jgi:glycosyltransferase involved in cell wall biosynthesis